MKKVIFTLLMSLLCVPLNVMAMTWDEASDIMYYIMAHLAEDEKQFLIDNNLGSDVDLGYVTKDKCIDYVVVLNNAQAVKSMSESELKENAEETISVLVELLQREGLSFFNEILSAMQREGGNIRICYKAWDKGEPVRKAMIFHANDLKRIAEGGSRDFPSPVGHTYTGKVNGMKVTFKFETPDNVKMTYNDGMYESDLYGRWYQVDDYVYISSEEGQPLQISPDGKSLYDVVNRVTLKAIK